MTIRGGFGTTALRCPPLPWPERLVRLMREVRWIDGETLTLDLRGSRKIVIRFLTPFHGTFDEALDRFHPELDRAQLLEDLQEAGYR